jgi:glutamyl-tRNA synthetase
MLPGMNRLPQPFPRARPTGRYAPSPTGALHLGNLRTALVAWQDIRARGGTFILRVEDIDGPRTLPGAEARMLADLRWLGIDWDEGPDLTHAPQGGPAGPYRQSERGAIYQTALDQLERAGLTYLCTCSRRDLREASAPHELHGPEGPPYAGACRGKDPATQRMHPNGAAVRFRVDAEPIVEFEDEALGPQRFDLRALCGDFVIRRRDGLWAYQLACAVDDGLMGVTRVVRGADLLASTPRQVALLRALGLPVPVYRHIPLVADAAGERMAKRDGSAGLEPMQREGLTPDQARARIMGMTLLDEG